MKDSLKKLKLKRNVVTAYSIKTIAGGFDLTDLMCNSSAFRTDGIIYHIK